MGRAANLSPLGLYQWDNTLFDFMKIPPALDKSTLIDNLLAETAELEVLYPNPVVFKNLIGVWSAKQIDIWNRLYETTQYDYNPIENYNRMEDGTTTGTGSTTHRGTDTTTDTQTRTGNDKRTENLDTGGIDRTISNMQEGGTQSEEGTKDTELGGKDTLDMTRRDGGTESKSGTTRVADSGSDAVVGTDTKGHWIAGFNSVPSGQDDGLVKQTRDQDDATTTTNYGKIESGTSSETTTFGKTETNKDETTYGKTESVDTENTITFGKTNNGLESTEYGKTEKVTENKDSTEQVQRQVALNHGENVVTSNDGGHHLHAHGNIGVTTTQKLIREQREIELFNIYDIIIEDFKMRFCILVY